MAVIKIPADRDRVGGVGVFALARRCAGGDKVVFPEGFDKGVALYDGRPGDNKQYANSTPARGGRGGQKGEPLPDGTVITLIQYKAKLDAAGTEKDATAVHQDGYPRLHVMEKRKGWGAEYDEKHRNGEWEYQAFTAARR